VTHADRPEHQAAPEGRGAVQGVLGPIAANDLGSTLFHEHLATSSPEVVANWPQTRDQAAVLDVAVTALRAVRDAGVATVIDHTTFDLGRDPRLLRDAADLSGVNVVAVTGFRESPPRAFQAMAAQQIADLWTMDATEGIAGTDVRAGLIKVAVESTEASPVLRTLLQAAAIAHHQTGLPITTHTSTQPATGHVVLDILTSHGVQPNQVAIGHAGDSTDVDYLEGLLERGAWLGLDRFGAVDILPDDQRLAVLAHLAKAGWASRLLLSHDASAWSGWRDNSKPDPTRPDWDMSHLHQRIRSQAVDAGLDGNEFDSLLADNPRRFLTNQP
jgi:phosphotriesterase-related protein